MTTHYTVPADADAHEMDVIRMLLDVWYERPAKDEEEEAWLSDHMETLYDRLTVLKNRQ